MSAEFNSAEPQWVVNFKKGIVSQILIDLTGVRASGAVPDLQTLTEGRSVSFQTFEVPRLKKNSLLNVSLRKYV